MTFSSACSAREKPPQADITIIDSQGAVAGEALIVLAAAKAAQEGRSKTEIVNLIGEDCAHWPGAVPPAIHCSTVNSHGGEIGQGEKEVCAAIMHTLVPEETITPASTSSPR
jgi:hypothetical protein